MKLTPNMNVLYDFFPGGNYIMIVRDPLKKRPEIRIALEQFE